jgi:hypothetical protein
MKRLMMFVSCAMLTFGIGFGEPHDNDDNLIPLPVQSVERVVIEFFARCTPLIGNTSIIYYGCDRTLLGCSGRCSAAYMPQPGIIGVCVYDINSHCTGRRTTITVVKFAEGNCTSSCDCEDLIPLPEPVQVQLSVVKCLSL